MRHRLEHNPTEFWEASAFSFDRRAQRLCYQRDAGSTVFVNK